MNIKKSILLYALINIFNLNAMLHKLTGNISKQHTKDHTQKILKRIQHQIAEEKLKPNKFLMTTLAVPAGMAGAGGGMLLGSLAGIIGTFVPIAIFNSEEPIRGYGVMTGCVTGAIYGGIKASHTVGGIPGATVWSISIFALCAKKTFDKYQNNKKKNC